MITHLVTGYAGVEHIQAEDDGAFNAAFFGDGQFVMESGSMFEGSIIDNNTVRILDGDLLTFGRHVRIKPNTYEDLTITTGTAGTNRYDLICMTYEKDTNDGTEKAYLEVIQGEESDSTPSLPNYIVNNILLGATKNQMPMYKVVLQGVVLKAIVPLFKTMPTYRSLALQYEEEFQKACKMHLDALNVLDTMEEVQANTQEYQLAGALALKELENTLKKSVSDGKTLLATTITDKTGVEVASDVTFKELNEVLKSNLGVKFPNYVQEIRTAEGGGYNISFPQTSKKTKLRIKFSVSAVYGVYSLTVNGVTQISWSYSAKYESISRDDLLELDTISGEVLVSFSYAAGGSGRGYDSGAFNGKFYYNEDEDCWYCTK